MQHVTLVLRPAAGSTLPTASWTRATARCRGFYACYLVPELNYNPITSNVVLRLCFFYLFYLLTVTLWQFVLPQRHVAATNLKMDQSAALHFSFHHFQLCFFFSFFQYHVEMCLVKLSNTANQEFSLSPAVSLDPKLPFSTPYSRTLCVVQQLLLSTVVFPIMCVLNPAHLTSDLEQHHTVL